MARDPILVVDDNPMNLKLVRFLLDAEGYEVRTAGDSNEALAALATYHPRLILMDIQLPGMTGLGLARALKADPATQDIVILALSAHARASDEDEARSAGCSGYITKPIDTRTFVATVKQHLGDRHAVKPALMAADYHDLLCEVRSTFLVEGLEEGERLLCGFNGQFDAERAKRSAHRWAGLGGTLGLDEIGRKARAIERYLESPTHAGDPSAAIPTGEYLSRVRSDLLELLQLFSEAVQGKRKQPTLPSAVVQALSGKTLALIGFGRAEAGRMAGALGQALASTSVFESWPDAETLRSFQGAIVNLSANLPMPLECPTPLLCVGSSEDVLRRWAGSFPRAQGDFVVAPWDGDEIVLRAHRLFLAPPEPAAVRSSQPLCAVIADDDPLVTALVSAALHKLGLECFTAHDGRSALHLAREKHPNVMVLDVKMPGLEGFEILMALKRDQRTRAINVVMLTGRDQESDMMRGFGYGADDYVIKPFKPAELAARVLRLLPQVAAPAYVHLAPN